MEAEGTRPKYVIVEFPLEAENDTVPMAVVSSKWLKYKNDGNAYCLWPTQFRTDAARMKAVHQHLDLYNESCVENRVNVKYSSVDYKKVTEKLKLLETYQSVSESESNDNYLEKRIPRSRKPNPQFVEDFTSEEEERAPTPPKFPKISTPKSCSRSSPSLSASSLTLCSNSTVGTRTMQCNDCSANKALIIEILENLKKIKSDVGILMRYVATEGENNDETYSDIQKLSPMTTKEELQNFNTQLQHTKEMQKMVCLLQTVGGKDTVDTTRRILSRLITNSLACEYNWTGKHQKGAFANLQNIKNLVTVTVRKNKLCSNATETDVEKAMKLWIRNAPDRDGGRSARKRKSTD